MALVTLARYKTAIRETSSANDAYHQDALDDASVAAASFCDRDFASILAVESRTFDYDGSGFLEIDDAASVNTVAYEGSSALSATTWEAKRDGPSGVPFSYIRLLARGGRYSGEMGFMNNADTYAAQYGYSYEVRVIVNANWGWPTVPLDIQRAIIWTAAYYETLSDTGGLLASESVADVAKSYAFQGVLAANTVEDDDIPPRAKAILAKYKRHVL